MRSQPPPRLLEAEEPLEPELAALLRAGREDLPQAAQLASLASRLGSVLGEAPPGAAPLAPTGGMVGGTVAPWVVPGLAAVLVGGLFLLGLSFMVPSPRAELAQARPAAISAPVQPVETPEVAAPMASDRVELDSAPQPEPEAPPPRTRRRSPVSPAQDPTAELGLLDEAQRALAQEPARALRRTQQHRSRYPRGVYAQEREVIAIEALVALGQSEKARRRAERFLRKYPTSSHTRAVRAQLDALLAE